MTNRKFKIFCCLASQQWNFYSIYLLYIHFFNLLIYIYKQWGRKAYIIPYISIFQILLSFIFIFTQLKKKRKEGRFQARLYSLWTVTHFGTPVSYRHVHRTTKNIKQTVMTSITKFTMNACKPLAWFTHQHQFHSSTKRHSKNDPQAKFLFFRQTLLSSLWLRNSSFLKWNIWETNLNL